MRIVNLVNFTFKHSIFLLLLHLLSLANVHQIGYKLCSERDEKIMFLENELFLSLSFVI